MYLMLCGICSKERSILMYKTSFYKCDFTLIEDFSQVCYIFREDIPSTTVEIFTFASDSVF